jgi:hypothetical protein
LIVPTEVKCRQSLPDLTNQPGCTPHTYGVETYSIAVHRPVKELGVSRVRAARTNGFAIREDMVTPNEFRAAPIRQTQRDDPSQCEQWDDRKQEKERQEPGAERHAVGSGSMRKLTVEGAITADEWIGNTAKDARQEIWRQAG